MELEAELQRSSKESMETRLSVYSGTSPFRRHHRNWWDVTKAVVSVLSGIIIAKFVILLVLLLLCYLFSVFATCGISDLSKPLPRSRVIWRWAIMGVVRLILLVFGFYWIPVKREGSAQASKTEAPRIVVGNHHTAFDAFILFWLYGGTAAAKADLRQIPIVGRIGDAFNVIWIERGSREGRRRAIEQITEHVRNPELPKLLIFPQGICSSVRTLTAFKTGAFIAGEPVQPVALDYWFNLEGCCEAATHDLSWTAGNIGMEFFWAGVQIVNWVAVTQCERYEPSPRERSDAQTFAENVRLALARQGLPSAILITRHAFEDQLLLQKARKQVPSLKQSTIVMENVYTTLQFRTKTVIQLAKVFAALDANHDGFIDFAEFCDGFQRKTTDLNMRRLWRVFNPSPNIGFEEFLVGVAVCYVDSLLSDALVAFFQGVDLSDSGVISAEGAADVIQRVEHSLRMMLKQAQMAAKPSETPKLASVSEHTSSVLLSSEDTGEHKADSIQVSTPESLTALDTQRLQTIRGVDFSSDLSDKFERELFGPLFESEGECIDFDTFSERVHRKQLGPMIQAFLQIVVCVRAGIKLDSQDFANADNVTVMAGLLNAHYDRAEE